MVYKLQQFLLYWIIQAFLLNHPVWFDILNGIWYDMIYDMKYNMIWYVIWFMIWYMYDIWYDIRHDIWYDVCSDILLILYLMCTFDTNLITEKGKIRKEALKVKRG